MTWLILFASMILNSWMIQDPVSQREQKRADIMHSQYVKQENKSMSSWCIATARVHKWQYIGETYYCPAVPKLGYGDREFIVVFDLKNMKWIRLRF